MNIVSVSDIHCNSNCRGRDTDNLNATHVDDNALFIRREQSRVNGVIN